MNYDDRFEIWVDQIILSLADIWGFCTQMKLSVLEAISVAQGKAAGIFPVDFARVLLSANESDWQLIRWLNPSEPTMFVRSLYEIGEEIIFSAMDKQDFQEGSL
ncbi:MAG TPA: hypothetical protein EYP41_08275 [Anaerolineae bacterium]|nr:hypothetical protein [Anaerolineae bacterium]HIP73675.1 hypothetical protein [Anaerolineae bacterium]